MFAGNELVTSSLQATPVLILQRLAAGPGLTTSSPVPFTVTVATSIDIFFYGTSTGDEIQVQDANTGARFIDWRPETAATQSLHWSGWQVFDTTTALQFSVILGTFDFRASGLQFLSQV